MGSEDMIDLSKLTITELESLAVAVDRQLATGVGCETPNSVVDLPYVHRDDCDKLCTTTKRMLRSAIKEIEEHNSEGKYWTGQLLINTMREAAGMEPGPVYNERAATSHY
jgi:hypothetical protein